MAANHEKIKQLIGQGMAAKEIANCVGCKIDVVYYTAKKYGMRFARKHEEYAEQIVSDRLCGMQTISIAEKYGIPQKDVINLLARKNINLPVKYRKVDRSKITNMLQNGVSPDTVAEQMGCCKSTVYHAAKESGYEYPERSPCAAFAKEIAEDYANGITRKEISQKYQVSENALHHFLISRGIKENKALKYESRLENAKRIIAEKCNGIEYAGGFVNIDSPVKLRCIVCGREFERAFFTVKTKGVRCPYCADKEKAEERERREKEKQQIAEMKRARKRLVFVLKKISEAKAQEERRAEKRHECPVCGAMTDRRKYCSAKCKNRALSKRKEMKRRVKIRDALIDNDITVESLYKRDGGICYLCGGKCNLEDYTTRNGSIICGDWYPSVDHVIPLAKGGEHSWANVRLAHRICNSLKSDTFPPEG